MRQTDNKQTASATPDKVREWKHPITGETREEIHSKRTKYTPQISANHCPNCGRKLSDCNGNCIFNEKRTFPAEKPRKCKHDNGMSYTEDGTRYFGCRDCGLIEEIPAEKPTDDGSDGFEREDGSETQYGTVEEERDAMRAHAAQFKTMYDDELTWYNDVKAHATQLAEALRECRMALTLDYHGSTKPKKALCDISAAASQAHNKAALALAAYESEVR